MKQLRCPLNGLRNISEFTYGGEFHPMPDPQSVDTRVWAEYLFFCANNAGVVLEWWCHTPTSYWFLAERDTRSDEVIRTFDAREKMAGSGTTGERAKSTDADV